MSILSKNFEKNHYDDSGNNINMIYDSKTDSYTLILKSPDSNIEVLDGRMNTKKTKIGRAHV